MVQSTSFLASIVLCGTMFASISVDAQTVPQLPINVNPTISLLFNGNNSTCNINELVELPIQVANKVQLELVAPTLQTGVCSLYLLTETLGNPIKLASDDKCTISSQARTWDITMPEGITGRRVLQLVMDVAQTTTNTAQKIVQCVSVVLSQQSQQLLQPIANIVKRSPQFGDPINLSLDTEEEKCEHGTVRCVGDTIVTCTWNGGSIVKCPPKHTCQPINNVSFCIPK